METVVENTEADFSGLTWLYTTYVNGQEIREDCNFEPFGEFTASYYEAVQTQMAPSSELNRYGDVTTSFSLPFSFNGVPVSTPEFQQEHRLAGSISRADRRFIAQWLTRVIVRVQFSLYTCATAAESLVTGQGLSQATFEDAETSNPTPFPRTHTRIELRYLSESVISSTADSTYVSTLLQERVFPMDKVTRETFRAGENQQGDRTGGEFVDMPNWIENTYGYYVRYNHTNKTTESRIVLLDSTHKEFLVTRFTYLLDAELFNRRNFFFPSGAIISTFIANMYAGDPRKDILTLTQSFPSEALDYPYSYVSYNTKTGYGYFTLRKSTLVYTYSVKLQPNLANTLVLPSLVAARKELDGMSTAPATFERTSFFMPVMRYVKRDTRDHILGVNTHVAPVPSKT
jgi:hypothetical protein